MVVCLCLLLALAILRAGAGERSPRSPYGKDQFFLEMVSPGQRGRLLAISSPAELERILTAAGVPPGRRPDPVRVIDRAGSPGVEIQPLSGAALLALGRKLDINRASGRELMWLPGIGPVTADRILRDREKQGPFETLSDLTRVRGIGPRTLSRLTGLAKVTSGDCGRL